MAVLKAKVPAIIAVGIVSMLIGGGIGAVVIRYVDNSGPVKKDGEETAKADTPNDGGSKKGPPDGAGGKGGGKGGFGGGKGGFGGGKGGFGGGKGGAFTPSTKTQLAQLVTKLDVLTTKPLTIQLTAEQKKQAKELLAGLEGAEELSEDDAKKKLEDLLKAVEGHKDTLEAAGFRWPGVAPGGGGPPSANPFKTGEPAADRLKSLQSTLGK
jgi:hypothetical protein